MRLGDLQELRQAANPLRNGPIPAKIIAQLHGTPCGTGLLSAKIIAQLFGTRCATAIVCDSCYPLHSYFACAQAG